MSSSIIPRIILFLILRSRTIHDAFVLARIVPNDDDLSVFPDSCPNSGRWTPSSSVNANCGIHRLDGSHRSWTLRSGDGVYKEKSAIVPGDILTDLYENGLIDDPLSDINYLDQRRIWMGDDSSDKGNRSSSSCSFDEGKTPLHDEYQIPNLEKRTRTWIYEVNFTLPSHDSTYINRHNGQPQNSARYNMYSRQTIQTTRGRRADPLANSENVKPRYALVVEGIKMGASIIVNGEIVGGMNVTDQFLRYIFPIPSSILRYLNDERASNPFKHYNNSLSVVFDPEIDTRGRFMACSGGWDWAPYSKATEASCTSRRVFSFGIFKPIYLIQVHEVAIVHVVPKISYLGDPSVRGLRKRRDGNEDNRLFELKVDVHLQYFGDDLFTFLHDSGGEIILRASFLDHQVTTSLNNEVYQRKTTTEFPPIIVVTTTLHIRRDNVSLWWPNGLGDAHLYAIEVAYRNVARRSITSFVSRPIGFRTVELITHKDHENKSDRNTQGTGSHGMYFRVNGIEIWTRGANVVPMSQLEGRLTDIAHETLVQSVATAHMNMLRVWGGGMVMPDAFYNSCDQKGILVYHDLMFVEEQYHSLERRTEVGDEIRHIVRSLASHPSIVLWNGCNECERQGNITSDAYSDFGLKIVGEEDPTKIIWPTSPSSGWESGVFAKNGMPTGSELIYKNDIDSNRIEMHGPYNHGYSQTFDSVNGHYRGEKYDSKVPIEVNQFPIGFDYPNYFVSEFGASVFSSFESMSSSLKKENWGLHGDLVGTSSNCTVVFENCNDCRGDNVMAQRNYPCDSHIEAYFEDDSLSNVGEKAFQRQLYKCMLSQMLWMKGAIEMTRNRNSFGSLIWQLNENWPTGGWGLVEYGSEEKNNGLVVGGRWKPLMYLLSRALFRNVFATCGKHGKCFVRNDGEDIFEGRVDVKYWNTTNALTILRKQVKLHPKSIEYFTIVVDDAADSYVLELAVSGLNEEESMGQNIVLMVPPKRLAFLSVDAQIVIESAHISDDGIEVTLKTDETVLYVVMTTTSQGRFTDNAFSMTQQTRKTVRFVPHGRAKASTIDINSFLTSLRIEHLAHSKSLVFVSQTFLLFPKQEIVHCCSQSKRIHGGSEQYLFTQQEVERYAFLDFDRGTTFVDLRGSKFDETPYPTRVPPRR